MSPLLAFLEHFEYGDGINLGRGVSHLEFSRWHNASILYIDLSNLTNSNS